MKGAIAKAEELAEEIEGSFHSGTVCKPGKPEGTSRNDRS